MSVARGLCLLPLMAALGGCHMVVMDPAGDVALQQRNLILIAITLMLLIAIPVMILTLVFAWRYRQSNTTAPYDPDWSHSTQLEMVIWAAPLAIIVVLGAVTWMSTHLLDPYRPLTRLGPSKSVAANARTLRVEVVAMDWKWLFIYPDLGVATVNELVAPVDTPIEFKITASSVMNSFFVPALAGQIYAMPGMETKLHAVINRPGSYEGFSANYSGEGFSDMRFKFRGVSLADFNGWVAAARAGGGELGRGEYLQLERPSTRVSARRYAIVAPDLYPAILGRCVEPGKMCIGDMMRADAEGGLGMAGVRNVISLQNDGRVRRGGDAGPAKTVVAAICAPKAGRDPVPLSK
jgi:cytochrome o ubiquinol oxidase subunit 2